MTETDLYPLRIIPEFVERIWGTHDVSYLFQHPIAAQPIGEVWLTGDQCRIANGPLQGRTLEELSRAYGAALIGSASAPSCPARFPLLMKVLFPRQKLSVQVHPDDIRARAVGQPCGKTESWYILDAERNAQIALGFNPGTTRPQIERSVQDHNMERLLNWIDVRAGEVFYVDAGTVHAIGPGSIILETQQNSDITYRLYDYGRPRELHIEQGLAAMKTATRAGKVAPRGDTLIASPCFTLERDEFTGPRTMRSTGAAHCLFALNGAARIETPGVQPLTFARGEMVVIPASLGDYSIIPQWTIELLTASVPSIITAEPETELYFALPAASHSEGR